jgi:hypothetical protein
MSVVTELNPKLAEYILKSAAMKSISVETYLREVIENKEDNRVSLMREAISDKLFMEDLSQTMEDFQYTDFAK